MEMYRYYKGEARELRWKCIETNSEKSRFESDEVMFATVLSISEKVAAGESVSEEALYQGPFYVDIDNEESTASALKTTKKVVNKLLSNGVSEKSIAIWVSGKKGFHVTVPMEVFTANVPVVKLPLVYKQMAIALKLFEMEDVDKTVYSSGKGRMWRLENKLRSDNQKYKIRITLEELETLTPSGYDEIAAKKRTLPLVQTQEKSEVLSALFELSKGAVGKMEKPKGVFIDENLVEALGKKLPPCVENLRLYENILPTKGFNEVSLQYAKGVASFDPGNAAELISDFAEKAKGNSYNTVPKRKQHCRTAFKIASKSAGYGWSCSSILGILKDEPCFDCPIAFIRTQEEDERKKLKKDAAEAQETVKLEEAKEPEVNTDPTGPSKEKKKKETEADTSGYNMEGLMSTTQGYGFMDGSGRFRRVCNFTLKITKIFVEYVPLLEMDRRVAIQAEVFIGGVFSGLVFLDEATGWSKSGIISAFNGLANAAFYGSDDDVQKMKSALMLGLESSEEIRKVHSIGIHRQKVAGKWVFTYVEPGWSVDQHNNENLYTLTGRVNAHPRLKNVEFPQQQDAQLSQLLLNLMSVNEPHRVSQVLGWYMAAFLKCHIFSFRNEFPLLSLHGEPGSGKTSTASLFANLHGIDYVLESSPLNLPATTEFPVWTCISQSTTVPRLLEEFNKSKMPRSYDKYTENFKACWNEHSVARGTLTGVKLNGGSPSGAIIQEIKLTGPVVLCSEQEINVPSLVERTVQIRFSKDDKETREYNRAYEFCTANQDSFHPLAKACYMEALTLAPEEIKAWVELAGEFVPQEISARPRYSYQVVIAGLMFLERVCTRYELSAISKVRELRQFFIEYLEDNKDLISSSKKVSEVDLIISSLATMAAISSNEQSISWLVKGQHYKRMGDSLLLDPLVAHAQYLSYVNRVQKSPPVIESYKEFLALIRTEKYCLSTVERVEGFARGRAVLKLSVPKLKEKKIPVEAFEED